MSLRITTDETIYLALSGDEVVQALFSTMNFDYSDVEYRGRLLDIPDAWKLQNILYDGATATLIFHHSDGEELRPEV